MQMQIKKSVTIALISLGVLGLSGCTTKAVESNPNNPTVAQVWRAAMKGKTEVAPNHQAELPSDEQGEDNTALPSLGKISAVQKTSMAHVLDSQFPRLNNPESAMYIFGHFAGDDQIPVPGHFITFNMYKKTYYGLPNEVAMPYNDGQFAS